MTPENFCYWLQGFFEISKTTEMTALQVEEIKNHLSLVFKKETPDLNELIFGHESKSYPDPFPLTFHGGSC